MRPAPYGAQFPNGGRLTIHEFPHVPSVVSGTAEEYLRVVRRCNA